MQSVVVLSETALTLLRRRTAGERVEVTVETRPAYREIAAAGLMIVGHSFTGGRESVYKFTQEGWEFAKATWPAEAAVPRC